MCTIAIHQPQYLPYAGFFHKLLHSDVFVLLDDVQFQKGGVQNRNKIKTGQGWQWVTVPVLHKSDQLISEVVINNSVPWQRKHLGAFETNYAPAPFFESIYGALVGVLSHEWKSLANLNAELVRWVMDILGIDRPLEFSSAYEKSGEGTDRLLELCRRFGGTRYLSGPGGRAYMDLDVFQRAGIEVLWQDFTPPVYNQVFPQSDFLPNLSIIDALFCCGPGFVEKLR
jgi:hypothetical protein